MRIAPASRIAAIDRRRVQIKFALITSVVFLAGLVLTLFPVANSNFYAPCPWRHFTGTFCPGCGSLRGISAVLHGQPLALLQNNIFAFVAAPFLAYAYASLGAQAIFGYRPPRVLAGRRTILAVAVLIVVFGIARNLVPALAPRLV